MFLVRISLINELIERIVWVKYLGNDNMYVMDKCDVIFWELRHDSYNCLLELLDEAVGKFT